MMKPFDYYQPQSLKEAYGLMEKQKGRAKYIAGGTDLLVRIKQRAIQPEALISLRGVGELSKCQWNSGLTVGSMVLLRDIDCNEQIGRIYPALTQAVSLLANPQVRNVATIGGNLCNAAPSADCAPPLLVLEANVTIEGPGGKRTVPMDDFFASPGETAAEPSEIVAQIHIPPIKGQAGMAFLKMGRVSQDISVVNAAALIAMEKKVCRKCRIAVGAVAPIPLRLKRIEKLVEGAQLEPGLFETVAKEVEQSVSPITDVRSSEAYRRIISGVLVKRALIQAMDSLTSYH
jgi:carbon-monoxide dehydrogenase medium subunit